MPSQVRVLEPDHPIVQGVPRLFEIPRTEMYDEPFHVPEPDEVILEERWAGGEWLRSGAFWSSSEKYDPRAGRMRAKGGPRSNRGPEKARGGQARRALRVRSPPDPEQPGPT